MSEPTWISRRMRFLVQSPLIPFDTEAEVVAAANDTPFGLASYLYTRDLARAWRVADALEYDTVGINEVAISNEVAPFWGIKESRNQGIRVRARRIALWSDEYLDIKYRCLGGLSA